MNSEASIPNENSGDYATLRALLVFAETADLRVSVSIHGASDKQGYELLQARLIDSIEPGPGSNPPTGKFNQDGAAQAYVYLAERHR